jgi:imidazole glycerol-phosphate synthase subunit HisH
LMTTHFGHDFDSIIQHENIYGAQFHPEKSHKFGMKLLENFAKL